MTPSQLLTHYSGNKTAAAASLGYTPQSIDNWIKKKAIPLKAQKLIELVTKGKLIARSK